MSDEWGLVLVGGGGKGSYQLGVMKALYENDFFDSITAVSGCSVGAINAALFSMGDIQTANAVWGEINPVMMLGIDYDLIDFKEGIVSRKPLIQLMDQYLDMDIISTSDKKLYVNTSNFGKRDIGNAVANYHLLNYQKPDTIKELILASTALPKIYEPVILGDEIHKDGGLTDNMPIKPIYDMGIRKIIVVELHQGRNIDYDAYPDTEFLFIEPSESLGDFVDGTLDFTQSGVKWRRELGYYDTIKILERIKRQ